MLGVEHDSAGQASDAVKCHSEEISIREAIARAGGADVSDGAGAGAGDVSSSDIPPNEKLAKAYVNYGKLFSFI